MAAVATIGQRSVGRLLARTADVVMLVAIVLLLAGLAMGYRPVILVTGSMAPTAPAGSLIVVVDVPRDEVAVDDIIVMRRGGDRLLTHRVIELSEQGDRRLARTKGDANDDPDPVLYEIEATQRVVTFIAPVVGSLLLPIVGGAAAVLLAAVLVLALGLLLKESPSGSRPERDHAATGGWPPPQGSPSPVAGVPGAPAPVREPELGPGVGVGHAVGTAR